VRKPVVRIIRGHPGYEPLELDENYQPAAEMTVTSDPERWPQKPNSKPLEVSRR